jgi:hypothetical protein
MCGNLKVGLQSSYYTLLNIYKNIVERCSFFVFMQDFFTVGIGWVLFGGLPFDLVSFDLVSCMPLTLQSPS